MYDNGNMSKGGIPLQVFPEIMSGNDWISALKLLYFRQVAGN